MPAVEYSDINDIIKHTTLRGRVNGSLLRVAHSYMASGTAAQITWAQFAIRTPEKYLPAMVHAVIMAEKVQNPTKTPFDIKHLEDVDVDAHVDILIVFFVSNPW